MVLLQIQEAGVWTPKANGLRTNSINFLFFNFSPSFILLKKVVFGLTWACGNGLKKHICSGACMRYYF